MEEPMDADLESVVMAAVKSSAAASPAAEVSRLLRRKGEALPSLELGLVLVRNLCFENNGSALWKLLEYAMAAGLVSPLHVLALLTARVIPHRKAQPEAYRLYLELLSRYIFAAPPTAFGSHRERITKSIDDVLQLSHSYGIQKMDFGHAVILFILNIITNLIDATLADWGLQLRSNEKNCTISGVDDHMAMDVDADKNSTFKRNDYSEQIYRTNAVLAMKMVEKITASKKGKTFLRLVYLNMPEKFNLLLQRLQFIEFHQSSSQSLTAVNEILVNLFANIQNAIGEQYLFDKHQLIGVLLDVGPCGTIYRHRSGTGKTTCWIPFDTFMENAMDGKLLHTISDIEMLTEMTRTLQVINQATWQETFQALWVSALQLVQRDREPIEGPIPHIDARLCMLLSVVPLAIVHIVKEEDEMPSPANGGILGNEATGSEHGIGRNIYGSRGHGLVSSLQLLGHFSSLLSPPPSVVVAANIAAAKAATFIFNIQKGRGNLVGDNSNSTSVKAVGNMLHLIVEACISRKLIDTSAYFWPGYVDVLAPSTESILGQESPWSTFMKGAPLTTSLRNALMMTPASSLLELEKLYHIAINGSEEERSAAAKILCASSLIRGWNIQEHAVHIVVKLLSPPVPLDYSRSESHLVGYKSMLNSLLLGLSCVDVVHILCLYGKIPEVAVALLPLCETFGSLAPSSDQPSSTSDENAAYSVFSCAFLFLLRLWKFYGPPLEHCISGTGGTVQVQLTLNFLLLMHNSRIALEKSTARDGTVKFADPIGASSGQPVCIDSFPNLRAWYFQNQACIASTLSAVCSKNPVHQVANKILNMICQKMVKPSTMSENPSSGTSSSSSSTPANSIEHSNQRPMLPAWEILEAVPFVLEAILTACAYGKLSSRDLTTGLRDLVDFLPASLATIVSYFSAEITRGIWKPVLMNGTDWPSPAANLHSFESEIKEVLKSVGVHYPSSYQWATTPLMIPLPMAALVSLTITFKLDKSMEYIHGVAGQALENSTLGCMWPSMPIIGALWSQKVRRWHDFIVLSCAHAPFTQDKQAVAQLSRSCFSCFLDLSPVSGSDPMVRRAGVSGLLGQAFANRGVRLPIAPGTLYLRSCHNFYDAQFLIKTILRLVIEWTRNPVKSFAISAETTRAASTLGASLLCIAGGLQMVQVLCEETLPMFLFSLKKEEVGEGRYCRVLEGYGLAHIAIMSGALVWGVGKSSLKYISGLRTRVIGVHMDFVAGVLEGKVPAGCDIALLRVYVLCLVSLMVKFAPGWVPELKLSTLRRLADGLRTWGENDLALALLERGGAPAIEFIVDCML
ncbi:uncharacterized protein M6B38_316745 [Iris pallida]|uniref:Mediator of RNA polymerase II transcription subunit 33A n=1 Tax=Iris pallida TaxID=29817 RepID=A0AAX6HF06_IRIPA|nr:uncharacterized protein M6B38_316745 [Iris pallida]